MHDDEPIFEYEEQTPMKVVKVFLTGLAVGLGLALLIGATASRFPLERAYLRTPLDGNAYPLTNVSSITFTNGETVVNPVITIVTNGDSSIGISSNAGMFTSVRPSRIFSSSSTSS